MEFETTQQKNEFLLRLARHLILHASSQTDLGLYHGKMGIVLFFAHYSRYTGEFIYDEFAGDLLDEIFDDIHEDIPINFEAGLCGIGWGIEYLLQNGFMEGDSNEILLEIDKKIMERDIRRIEDQSVQRGLTGISYYIHKRVNSSCRDQFNEPFDPIYLKEWEKNRNDINIPSEKHILSNIYATVPKGHILTEWPLGLEKGCAGIGLNFILV